MTAGAPNSPQPYQPSQPPSSIFFPMISTKKCPNHGRKDTSRSLRQTQRSLLQHCCRTSSVAIPNPTLTLFHTTILIHHTSSARNSKPLEVLGTYDPIPKPAPLGEGKPIKDIKLDTARAKYWLGVGAQPSDPAWRLLSMVCLFAKQSKRYVALKEATLYFKEADMFVDRITGAKIQCAEDAAVSSGTDDTQRRGFC